jgi:hypothetical protein
MTEVPVEEVPVERVPAVAPVAAVPGAPAATPGLTGLERGAFKKLGDTIEKEVEIGTEAGLKEAAQVEAYAKEVEARQLERKKNLEEIQKFRKDTTTALENNSAELAKAYAESKKDYWTDKGAGARISANIARALGGAFAKGAGGDGVNQIGKDIDADIQRDTDAKLKRLQLVKDQNSEIRKDYDTKMGLLKDEGAVRDAMMADSYAVMAAKIQGIKARTSSDMVRLNADKALAEIMFKKSELQKASAAAAMNPSAQQKMEKLPNESKARLDNARSVAESMQRMRQIIKEKGKGGTFSLVGDNEYTMEMDRAAEAYGRMQSGGAINKDEEARFMRQMGSLKDSADIIGKKIDRMDDEMTSRMSTLGFKRSDFPSLSATPAAPAAVAVPKSYLRYRDPKTGQEYGVAPNMVATAKQRGWTKVN